MREIFTGGFTGLLFGLGLCVAGMTNPAIVLGFLDVAGLWNPALLFVMAAGVVVTFIGYRVVWADKRPVWAEHFTLPAAAAIDPPLLIGAILFGIGWGLAGYCPGPAIASLASGRVEIFAFVAAMLVGMAGVKWVRPRR